MKQIALSFLTGFGAAAFITRPSSFGFTLGIVATVATVAALIGSAKGARRAARFLLILADGVDGKQTVTMTGQRRAEVAEMPSAIERDVQSALANFGMNKKAAAQLARETVDANPDADTLSAVSIAIRATRKAVAR
jgi:Holliday junction resolvasome RuvABC DNA-binding subunit